MSMRKSRTAIVAIAIVIVALLLVEIVARLVGRPRSSADAAFIEAPEWNYPEQIAKDRELFWTYKPNQVISGGFFAPGTYTINSLGFRGPEPQATKPANGKRVVCIGESTTFGWGVSDELAYPRQLELQLNRLDPEHRQWEVINAGVTNYSSYQGVHLAQRWLPVWKPDIVLYNFSWADHQPAGRDVADAEIRVPPLWRLRLNETLRKSVAVQWALHAGASLSETKPQSGPQERRVWRVGLTDLVSNIEKLTRAAQIVNARPVYVTSPISWPPPGKSDTSGIFHYHQRYRRMVRYGADNTGAEFAELANAFDQHPEFFSNAMLDNEHFNAAGHVFAGEFLARYILGVKPDTTDSKR